MNLHQGLKPSARFTARRRRRVLSIDLEVAVLVVWQVGPLKAVRTETARLLNDDLQSVHVFPDCTLTVTFLAGLEELKDALLVYNKLRRAEGDK